MIEKIEIENFRCFSNLAIPKCQRINLIVGDNGVGKTALLEALFITLSGNVEVSVRMKIMRGFDQNYQGSPGIIEEAIWRDYFRDGDWTKQIAIRLSGSGVGARSLRISRGGTEVIVPFNAPNNLDISAGNSLPLVFDWTDSTGNHHVQVPRITPQGLQIGVGTEDLPNFYLFGSNQTVPAVETASRFSQLSRENRERPFVDVLCREYPWIKNLNIEVIGGSPSIHATLADNSRKVALNAVSGGINRIIAVLLAIASSRNGIVIVDEIENGLYYKHKTGLWRAILSLARDANCQLFVTTHDEEWLEALAEASEDRVEDIALWRMERSSGGPQLRQFSGATFVAGIDTGGEIR